MKRTRMAALAFSAVLAGTSSAFAWTPTKPVEFVVTSGPGGGTDNFARTVQSIIMKHKLMPTAVIVTNKGGGSGAEGFVYAKAQDGDPHKLTFGTNNEYMLPQVAKLGYKPNDLNPVAVLALDEFLIWVNAKSDYQDARSFIAAAKESPGKMSFAGSQSKDTDQILVAMIESATGTKFRYVPFQGGSAAAVQLAGNHVDANTNNPNENIGQWQAGMLRPLCVFSPERLPKGAPVYDGKGWNDVPTCAEAGVPIDSYKMPRTVWTSPDVPADATAYYAQVMKKVYDSQEWKDYLTKTSQTGQFMSGDDFKNFIKKDEANVLQVLNAQGWTIN